MTATAQGIGTRIAHDPGDPLITSHCPFCGSGQVVGRSDGTIGCEFCGQNYIVRVQPAFPGMPQMPGPGGAPSDIGPDGGMVDPGMIGPDGMPADGGMPPDDGDPDADPGDGGAPPFGGGGGDDDGGDGGDDSGGPPPGAKKKDSGGPPPKGKGKGKGKSKKKGALIRTYRGLGGQVLTEDQFVRHMAVALSGSHPAVLAAVRREAMLHYTPHVREVLPLHMMSHHGWSPAEVREALEWPEAANALPHHHEAEHVDEAYLPHRIPHAHEDVSHDLDAPEWTPPPVTGGDTSWLRDNGIASRRRRP